jgi:predicted small secreted protein
MAKKKRESFFWTSYSDLMTSLFFIMLTLFVLAIALLHREVVQIGKERDATEAELEKINEIRTAVQSIDSTYFSYDPAYKKHILKTEVKFKTGSSNINDLDQATQTELLAVRDTIKSFLDDLIEKDRNASYLLILEGQASKDNYSLNNQLSYDRALSLFKFWFPNQKETTLQFYNLPCEVVIAGAGYMEGKPRAEKNADNQRFLIQIIPKPGIIDE